MEHFAQLPDESVRATARAHAQREASAASAARLPDPVRRRVMEELESDASALQAHFRGRGMSEEAAAHEVEAWLGPPPEVWRELEEIHRPIAVRWADRMLEPQQHRVERVVFLMAAMLLLTTALPLRATVIVQAPYGTGWLVLAMGCATILLALLSILQRWRPPARRIGLHESFVLLALGTPVMGLLGAGLTLSRVNAAGLAPWTAIGIASGTLTVGVIVGIAAGVMWSLHRASVRTHSRRTGGGG
jgi:hypothetical protein